MRLCLLCLGCLLLVFGASSGGGGRSGGGRISTKGFLGSPPNVSSSKGSKKQPLLTNVGGEVGASKTAKTGTGLSFLSAWGIISLILFFIIGSALTYYVSIFYPLLCAKRGKYDVMEMTAV